MVDLIILFPLLEDLSVTSVSVEYFSRGKDGFRRSFVVVPHERSPLPKAPFDAGRRKGRFVDGGIGGETSFYP